MILPYKLRKTEGKSQNTKKVFQISLGILNFTEVLKSTKTVKIKNTY